MGAYMSWEVGGWRHLGLLFPLPLEIHKSLGNMAFLGPFDILINLQKFFLNNCDPSPLKKFSIDDFVRLMYDYGSPEKCNDSSFHSLTYGPGSRVLVA